MYVVILLLHKVTIGSDLFGQCHQEQGKELDSRLESLIGNEYVTKDQGSTYQFNFCGDGSNTLKVYNSSITI